MKIKPRLLWAFLFPPYGMWVLLYGYVNPQTSQDKKEFLLLIAQSIAGMALIGGLFFTWWNMDIARDTTAKNLQIANETLRIAQDGQITERFSRAIDQLGDRDRLEVRLGGIHSLERIARNSEADHWPIIEVLTAYVRQNAPWPPFVGSSKGGSDEEGQGLETLKPAQDIQAILTVLGRSLKPFDQRADYQRVDLHNTDLRGATFLRSNLEGVMFRGANLAGVDFRQTCLKQADLTDANLEGADLRGANLTQAALFGANFDSTDLTEIFSTDHWEDNTCSFVPQEQDVFVEVVGLTMCQLASTASHVDARLPEIIPQC